MPQLDIYILNNMLIIFLIIFAFNYNWNAISLLFVLNIIFRLRKIKMQLKKKIIFYFLNEILDYFKIKFYWNILLYKNNIFKKILFFFICEDILDIKISVRNLKNIQFILENKKEKR